MEVNIHKSNHYQSQLKSKKPTKVKKKPIKVTYISSPMMVRANNASEFRTIVQELTGQNSDLGSTENAARIDHISDEAMMLVDHGIFLNTKGASMDGGDYECSNGIKSLAINEASFWRDVSESSFALQFPCTVLV